MVRYSATTTLVGLLSILSSAVANERLIGGMAATEGMFPYVVHLFKNDRPYCGGVLIDKEWVLTAAHCVAKTNGNGSGAGSFTANSAGDFKVSYGSTDGTIGNYVDVDSITVSPDFDPIWYKSDIALLKIKSNNDLVSKTKTVVISAADISTGQTLITAGWGQITNDNTAQAGTLMYAGLTTADDATCKSGAPEYDSQNGLYVCTSYSTAPGIGTCFGDSGGPLLINTGSGYMLLGLVSFDVNTKDPSNTRCAQDGNVSYFTRVSTYISFITSTTNISKSLLVGPGSASTHSNSDSSADDEKSNTSKDGDDDTEDDGDSKDKDDSSKNDSSSSEKGSDKNDEFTGKTEEEKESAKSDGKGKEAGDKVNNDNEDEENAGITDDDSSAPRLLAIGAVSLVANLAATLFVSLI
ncbi:Serine protease 56 [Coemansia sp. RSA 1365]|nr:Serine protease 56 [Coemansia sp. RSA 1365]